jgi:mitochondrial fusion and transport protein UGO1
MDPSEYAPYARIATSRDTPNPLRPYYIPPSIGIPEPASHPDSLSSSIPSRGASNSSSAGPSRDFRELFSDLEYGDYLPTASPSMAEMTKRLVDQAIWNYTSVVMAQPFEVAKIVLQCHAAGAAQGSVLGMSGEDGEEKRLGGQYEAQVSLIVDADDVERDR